MTRNETVNGILNEMTIGIWYHYYELFRKHFNLELVKWKANDQESKAILHLMVSKKLIRKLNTLDKTDITKLTIMLTKRGFRIKEEGGWLAYVERRRNRVDRFFRIIAGIESIIIIGSIAGGWYLQETSKNLAREHKQLRQTITVDSLRMIELDRLLGAQESRIEKMQKNIDSLKRPSKPKKGRE